MVSSTSCASEGTGGCDTDRDALASPVAALSFNGSDTSGKPQVRGNSPPICGGNNRLRTPGNGVNGGLEERGRLPVMRKEYDVLTVIPSDTYDRIEKGTRASLIIGGLAAMAGAGRARRRVTDLALDAHVPFWVRIVHSYRIAVCLEQVENVVKAAKQHDESGAGVAPG